VPSLPGLGRMSGLSHLDDQGRARMVDVGGKTETQRVAIALGTIRMARATLTALRDGKTPKGDVLAVAAVAGIMAAKRTARADPPVPSACAQQCGGGVRVCVRWHRGARHRLAHRAHGR